MLRVLRQRGGHPRRLTVGVTGVEFPNDRARFRTVTN